jgi:hypothetical protein
LCSALPLGRTGCSCLVMSLHGWLASLLLQPAWFIERGCRQVCEAPVTWGLLAAMQDQQQSVAPGCKQGAVQASAATGFTLIAHSHKHCC